MKKIFIATLILVSCAVFASAQIDCSETPKAFEPTSEEFSIESPKEPVLFKFSPEDLASTRLYKNSFCGAQFFIASEKNTESSQYKKISQLAEENQAKGFAATVGNLKGEKFSFADSEGYYQTILAIQGNNRFYIFHAVSAVKDNPAVESFFKSIKFDKSIALKKIPEAETGNAEQSNSIEKQENKTSGTGVGSGRGTGSGSGIGSGSDSSADTKSNNQTTPLKILSSPRAEYTDLARFYEITGTVTLRVTFLPDGKIGEIIPISKLPMGLLKNSIEAAKAVRFEPAMRNGTPYSTVKAIQYRFIIY